MDERVAAWKKLRNWVGEVGVLTRVRGAVESRRSLPAARRHRSLGFLPLERRDLLASLTASGEL